MNSEVFTSQSAVGTIATHIQYKEDMEIMKSDIKDSAVEFSSVQFSALQCTVHLTWSSFSQNCFLP